MKNRLIGIWAGSSPSPAQDLQKGLERLKDLDCDVVFPKLSRVHATRPLSKTQKYLAGPDKNKVLSLVELFKIKNLKTILALRGGYGTLRLLPLLDKTKIPQSHPILWGYSDLTVLQNYLFSRTKQPWVHGPMLSSKSFYSPNRTESRYWKKVFSEQHTHSEFKLKTLYLSSKNQRSSMKNILVGGNLASLVSMMGTPWSPQFSKGSLLFLEEVTESPYRLERLLVQLSYHQDFRKLGAIVLGHFTECPNALPIIKIWAQENKISVFSKVPSGHEAPHLPILLGDKVVIDKISTLSARITLPNPKFG